MMVKKDWTLEEAQAATEAALKANPERSCADPTLPLFQWVALHRLDDCKAQYEKDNYWLMTAIRICANHDLPLPEWAARAYIKAYDTVNNYRARSWDTVFGTPFPKGKQLKASRQCRELMYAVWNEITMMLELDNNELLKLYPEMKLSSNKRLAIDPYLFECVGNKFNIKKTLASEYYYAAKKQLGF